MNWPTFGDYFLCAAYLGVPLSDIDGIGSVPGDSDPDTVLVESGADILSPLLYREKAGHRAVRAMESLFCRLSSLVPGSSLFDRKELGAGDAVRLVEPRFFKDGGAHEIALTYLVYDDSWKRSLDEVCRVFGYARFAGDLDLSAPLDPKNVVVYSSRIWTREYYDRKNETNQMDFGQFDFGWKKAGSGSFFPTIRSLGCK